MGMLLKSTIGLGAVYFAMFAPTIRGADIGPTTSLCGDAVRARLDGDATLRAQWSAAGCAVKLVEAQGIVSAPAPAPPPKPAPPALKPAAPPKAAGTLTEADLAEPWFGPARPARKSGRRG